MTDFLHLVSHSPQNKSDHIDLQTWMGDPYYVDIMQPSTDKAVTALQASIASASSLEEFQVIRKALTVLLS